MTIQEIKKISETEDKIEFKEAKKDFSFAGGRHVDVRERRRCILGYIVALANEGGGHLVLGVKETTPNEIVGTSFAAGKIGEVEDEIYKRLSIRVKIDELFDEKKRVLVFKIPARPVTADKKYVLGDLYYEIAKQPAYIMEYRMQDLLTVANCFEKANEVSMKNFVKAFDNVLTREQVKALIYKLENAGLIIKEGLGRWTIYKLSKKIDNRQSIIKQFQFHIEA